MGRWFGLALIALIVIVGVGAWVGDRDGGHWRGHDTEVVTAANGQQTIVVHEGRGFFPFPFLIFPFLIFGFFWFASGRRRWYGPGPWGYGPPNNLDRLQEWHRQQHQASGDGSHSDSTQS
jgi:hypothetical protein